MYGGLKMLTFLAFLLVILGGIDWLLVGLLQYDYVAGLFGYQASIFSRLIYIIVGAATIFIVIKAIIGKGKLNLVDFKFKFGKKKKEAAAAYNISASEQKNNQISGKDYSEQDKYNYMKEETPSHEEKKSSNNLFDDMKN